MLEKLAASIRTPADARILINSVANLFTNQLLPVLTRDDIRERLAQREFTTVSDPRELIPEERIAEAWNAYAQKIEASREQQVTAAEIHNLRETFFITARLSWQNGMRTIWTVPAIYATQDSGGLAAGCRAIESIRILWDLSSMPENLHSARLRIHQGVPASVLFDGAQGHTSMTPKQGYVSAGPAITNPMNVARRAYAVKYGSEALGEAVVAMLNCALCLQV